MHAHLYMRQLQCIFMYPRSACLMHLTCELFHSYHTQEGIPEVCLHRTFSGGAAFDTICCPYFSVA